METSTVISSSPSFVSIDTPSIKPSLTSSIKNKYPHIGNDVLSTLHTLIEKHNLEWIPDKNGTGGYFLSTQLSLAKGNNTYDFAKRWKENKETITSYYEKEYAITPRVMKLTGKELKSFKELWLHYTGKDLGRIPSIFVCDFITSYWYLTQGNSDVSLDFSKLGVDSILSNHTTYPPVEESIYLPSEEELQNCLALLSTYSIRIKLTQEETVANTLEGKAKHRRFDLVERRGSKEVIVYELKKGNITSEHVRDTIGVKGYLELARSKYKNKKVRLVFLSPTGIDKDAARLIKNNPYVSYKDYGYLLDRLKSSIKKQTSNDALWYVYEVFDKVIPPRIVTLLLPERVS